MWSSDDVALTINYKTEEITPIVSNKNKIKVLLLFKNPHPDSVAAGLFLSEPHSQAFWERLFEVDYNCKLLPLLNKRDWIGSLADTLLTGKYNSPFLYYFRCLYPFPTRQFADLQQLFAGAPSTYRTEILDRSLREFTAYVEQHGIRNVIVFFKDAVEFLGGRVLPTSINAVATAKQGIDQAIAHGDDSLFWRQNSGFRQKTNDGLLVYLNMNTRAKNHGTHLPKRYFTYNLEFILKDILKNSLDQNNQ
ncbi:MAG: hypothetical protein D4R56_00885 [Deltaproteobacteria bacterium]|nr:MAG: hypothetical protein D4R56_00885 [Deltaproteobacteria bacterium]